MKDILEAGQINLSNNLVAENAVGASVGTVSSMAGAAYTLVDNAGGRLLLMPVLELYL